MPSPGGELRISIIVPSYNHARFLPDTLDSIFQQNYAPLEVIVVDGASTDGTLELLERYGEHQAELRWFSEPDDGPADAVNKGLKMASGDIVGIQSSDDIYYSQVFAEVSRTFRENPGVGFVYGDVDGIGEDGKRLYTREIPEFSWEAFFGVSMAIPQSSIFFRRNLYDQIGGWDGRYYSCDIEYWLRLLFRTQAVRIPRSLSGWRRYPGQRTSAETARKIWDGYWAMIDESSDVARASRRVRRLAVASKHILAMRFPPYQSGMVVWWHLLIATLLHPDFWRHNPRGLYLRWLPGFAFLYAAYARARGGRRQVAGSTADGGGSD